MAGRPHTVAPEELRLRVQSAATTLFAEKGFDSTTIDQIVSQAEVSKPAFYRSFSSKSNLYCALIEQHAIDTAAVAHQALASTTGSMEQKLPAMIDAWFAHIGRNPDLFQLLHRDSPADPDVKETCERIANLQVNNDKTLIRSFLPTLPPREVDALAHVIRASLVALGTWWLQQSRCPRSVPVGAMLRVCNGILLTTKNS
jgi:AcrR family transcriptional regulator